MVGFFAKNPISCGTELMFHYGNEYDLSESNITGRKRKQRKLLNEKHFKPHGSFNCDFAPEPLHQ